MEQWAEIRRLLRPVRPGPVTTRGRVVHRDGDHATLEATLWDTAGEMSARATAVAQVIPLARAAGALFVKSVQGPSARTSRPWP